MQNFQGIVFFFNQNIYRNFQIRINVPLKYSTNECNVQLFKFEFQIFDFLNV